MSVPHRKFHIKLSRIDELFYSEITYLSGCYVSGTVSGVRDVGVDKTDGLLLLTPVLKGGGGIVDTTGGMMCLQCCGL